MSSLQNIMRIIPDFPKPGIQFQDINPILRSPKHFSESIKLFEKKYQNKSIDIVACIESRGFIFGSALAQNLGCGIALIRKAGKLPGPVFKETYELEYGTDSLEVQSDAFENNNRVLIIDDVLATGGTAKAAYDLITCNFNIKIIGITFLLELNSLDGRQKLNNIPVFSLLQTG